MTQLAASVNSTVELWTVDTLPVAPYATVDSETVEISAKFPSQIFSLTGQATPTKVRVHRGVGGTTAASHTNGATLTPVYGLGGGTGGGGVIVDNQDDPPAEVTTLIAPGAVIVGDEADMSDVVAVRKIVTTLTDAQIKTLPTTAVVVIPAPGANVAVVPLFCHLRCAAVADYTNIDPTSSISLNSFDVLALLTNDLQNAVTGLLAPGDADDAANAFISLTQLVNEGTIRLNGISSIYDSDASNEAVTMGADNAALGNFTGGNAANELTVTVLYVVLDLS